MKLYYYPLSGHSHRARLFASLLQAPHELIEVDLAAGEHKTPEFLARNAFGQVPVLEDGDVVVPDSNAILIYLAKKVAAQTGSRRRRLRLLPCSAGSRWQQARSPMAWRLLD